MAADYVNEINHVTFVELRRLWAPHCDVVGDLAVCLDDNPNIVLWAGVSERFCRLVALLENTGKVTIKPTAYLTYLLSGGWLVLPQVKTARRYKKPHWLPVVFCRRDGK